MIRPVCLLTGVQYPGACMVDQRLKARYIKLSLQAKEACECFTGACCSNCRSKSMVVIGVPLEVTLREGQIFTMGGSCGKCPRLHAHEVHTHEVHAQWGVGPRDTCLRYTPMRYISRPLDFQFGVWEKKSLHPTVHTVPIKLNQTGLRYCKPDPRSRLCFPLGIEQKNKPTASINRGN